MLTDTGDMIFQKNITHLFKENPNKFRAVVEDRPAPMLEYTLIKRLFPKEYEKEIEKTLKNKDMMDGGMIIASNKNFKKLCENMDKLILNKNSFGPDQVILNYTLYKTGFKKLPKKYNYVIGSLNEKFTIKQGVFYDVNNEIVSIVHNTGRYSFFRPIKNFGYGKDRNKFSYLFILLHFAILLQYEFNSKSSYKIC